VVLGAALAHSRSARTGLARRSARELGVVGITLMSGLVAWMEYLLLRRALARRIGPTGVPGRTMAVLWGSALLAGAVALAAKAGLARLLGPAPELARTWGGWLLPAPAVHAVGVALLVLPIFGAGLALTAMAGRVEPESLSASAGPIGWQPPAGQNATR
jgi:hypothetical protein